jgi:hypothetical protein
MRCAYLGGFLGQLWFSCSALASVACGSDEATVVAPGGEGAMPSGPDDPGGDPRAPAILIAGVLVAPDNINVYVGAFPDVPRGELDYSRLREFGNANVYTGNGYVFVEEGGVVSRFSVGDDYDLVPGPRMSWTNYGFAEANQSYIVFGSPTRAYAFVPPIGLVIVWNPETMEITGTLPLDLPTPPDGFETYAYDGLVVGDKVVWNVLTANWETYEMDPGVLLAMTDATEDAPLRFVRDDRCLAGGTSLADAEGNLYVHAGGNLGVFAAYSPDPDVRTCMLRMNAGEDTFDPDFMADYRALTGSYVSYPWVHVAGNQYLVKRWDPAVPLPESPDDYWDNPALSPFLVDTETGAMEPYPDVAGGLFMSGIPYVIDGVSYFEVSESGAVEGGTTDVVMLTPEGTAPQFHMNGTLSALARIR